MDLGIAGRTALVTAASKGLGLGAAVALAEEGAKVVICARGAAALAEAEARIRAAGGDVLAVVADVTEPGAPAELVARTVEHFGGLDILVANAGGPPPGRALEVTDEQLAAALNDNLLTSIRLLRESVPHMRKAGWGRICAITSFGIKQPIPGLALSNVARTALWAWAKTAAADLAPDNITLNLTAPGHHDTERMRKLGATGGPMGRPDDFGKIVAFLCSEPANFVNGVALQVDGGATQALS
jgi:3-oxoacyl-[acyl-carrier protein] reductase